MRYMRSGLALRVYGVAAVLLLWTTAWWYGQKAHEAARENANKGLIDHLESEERLSYCSNTFGTGYLSSFATFSAEYCIAAQTDTLTCFQHIIDPAQRRLDDFCVAHSVKFDKLHLKFALECELEQWPQDEDGNSMQPLSRFTQYWYSTGPAWIFGNFFNLGVGSVKSELSSLLQEQPRPTLLLIKREIANINLWHNLMELMSASHSIEILKESNKLVVQKQDIHVVLLDDDHDGPYLSSWGLITPNPVLRLADLAERPNLHRSNTIIPIPGGANPFWQGDWVDIDCGPSPLLRSFSGSILSRYEVDHSARGPELLTITIIDRHQKRRLIDQDILVSELKSSVAQEESESGSSISPRYHCRSK